MNPFREMRRKRQALPAETCREILARTTSGTLAVLGDGGYPYAVPLSHVYHDGALYFHSAKAGHKLDAIRKDDKVSFCVVEQDLVVPEEYTTYFRSVVAFGRARIVEEREEKRRLLEYLAERFCPGETERRAAEVANGLDRLVMIVMTIEHLTGKEAIELVRQRERSGAAETPTVSLS